MSIVLNAKYDDATHSLRLPEPLEGFADQENVSVIVDHAESKRPWSDLRGLLSGEEGEKFARDIEEAFPIEPVTKPGMKSPSASLSTPTLSSNTSDSSASIPDNWTRRDRFSFR